MKRRFFSKSIDFLVILLFNTLIIYPLGSVFGFLYSLLADGMPLSSFQGQSIGKKIFKLQVKSTVTKKPANWKDSLIRNTSIGVGIFFSIIPIWGWLIFGLIGVPLIILETYLILTVKNGHRLGDVMSDTEVSDYHQQD